MPITKDQFDGEFINVSARDIQKFDVILGGARGVTAPPIQKNDQVDVTTVTGTETFNATASVYVFRPAVQRVNEECPICFTDPGVPCDSMCLTYALIDDAAETN